MRTGNSPGRLKMLVTEQEQRVEHDRLGERDGENSVHEHLRERAGIATDRRGHSQAGQADSDSDAHRGKPDVNASGYFC